MTTATADSSGIPDQTETIAQRPQSERLATGLVTFVFSLNVVFLLYLLTQFFVQSSDGTGLGHILIIVFNTLMLAYSTRCLWVRKTKVGCYAFFAAIIVSGIANAIVESLT